jgi:pimeloyl-ACP methyl ester carboxylesterase
VHLPYSFGDKPLQPAHFSSQVVGVDVEVHPARAVAQPLDEQTDLRTSELLRATASPGPGRGYYYQLLAAVGWTSLPLLPLVCQPTLILAGDDDRLTPWPTRGSCTG